MKVALAAIAMLALLGAPAAAGDHPYAGVWGEADADAYKNDPEFYGIDNCYNRFTEQRPDGSFRHYLVDHAKWLDERKIEYLLAQEGTCIMRPTGKSEKCTGRVAGETDSDWFIGYAGTDEHGVRATFYENVFYFEKGFNGVPIVRHKCPFDMERMKPFITGKTIADCKTRCRSFAKSEAEQFREMVNEIKARK